MKGIGYKITPLLILGLFIFIMTSGSFLKKPLFDNDDVVHYVDLMRNSIRDENWDIANRHLHEAESAWRKIIKRIQFSSEREEVRLISRTFSRIKGFIEAEDQAGALAEIEEVEYIWKELGK